MAVKLAGSCPRMQEAFQLGRECGAVYAVMWEAAWHDDRGQFGGTTQISHKALADICGMSSKTVIKAVDLLMDDGLISCEGMTHSWGGGSQKRIYRVTHPDQLEARRAAIETMGDALLPSDRARAKRGEKREVEYALACEDL
jgi:DNA-binding transcriptional MocR family regulator